MGERELNRLKIETYTPVSIGSGTVMSPITDFFVSQKELCFLNKPELSNAIAEKRKTDLFSKQIAKSINASRTGTNFSIDTFIKRELGMNPANIVQKQSHSLMPLRPKNKLLHAFYPMEGHLFLVLP